MLRTEGEPEPTEHEHPRVSPRLVLSSSPFNSCMSSRLGCRDLTVVWFLSVCDRTNPRQIVLPLCYTAIPSIGVLRAWRVAEWKRHLGVGEMAQGLRALAVLQRTGV